MTVTSAPQRSARLGVPMVVFDGDDTLWKTERLYDEARAGARAIVAGAAVDPDRWEDLERTTDVANVASSG